jgi:hypothetical protein
VRSRFTSRAVIVPYVLIPHHDAGTAIALSRTNKQTRRLVSLIAGQAIELVLLGEIQAEGGQSGVGVEVECKFWDPVAGKEKAIAVDKL